MKDALWGILHPRKLKAIKQAVKPGQLWIKPSVSETKWEIIDIRDDGVLFNSLDMDPAETILVVVITGCIPWASWRTLSEQWEEVKPSDSVEEAMREALR